ncbi:MAG TPA: hypothetical protein VGH28_09280, partial [Polyangiaceae bacterium]
MKARWLSAVLPVAIIFACGGNGSNFGNGDGGKSGDGGNFGDGPSFGDTGPGGDGGPTGIATCADAANAKSYVGCDYWPT